VLADAHCFGFESREQAASWLDDLLVRIAGSFDEATNVLDDAWRQTMAERLHFNLAVLGASRQLR